MDINSTVLSVAVYLPFACALALAPIMGRSGRLACAVSVFGTGVSGAASVWLWIESWLGGGAPGAFRFAFDGGAVLPFLALNGVSAPLLALAGITGFAAAVWAASSEIERKGFYLFLLMIMQGGLMGAFASVNVLCMYAFHEFALVPTFIAMCVWGGAGKRMAAMQMAVYLTLGALVSLVGIVALKIQSGAPGFAIYEFSAALARAHLDGEWQKYIFGMLLFGLGTLVSLFPFHSWAPRTYAAAPTSFAMLHAGVLKKFGLYLLIQFAVPFVPMGAVDWSHLLAILALFNVIYIGFVTMAQDDLKLMVSYSSVSHMGMCFLGIATLSATGVGGALMLMFGHGLSAALLFMLSNAVVNKTGEWDMRKMGGMYRRTPILAAFFAAATFASIGLPGFANFFGELSIFVALWKHSPWICAAAATGLIISAVYGLRAVARIFMGGENPNMAAAGEEISDLSAAQRVAAVALLAGLLFVGFCPASITKGLDGWLSTIPVYNLNK